MTPSIRTLCIGGLCAFPVGLSAQAPSVLNGGFELYSTAPSAPGQWYQATQWGNAGSSEASPDFFHEDGSGGGDLPETPLALVSAFEGRGVMGFTAAATDGSNRREYVVGRFSAPLTPGEHYRLRFALTNGEVTAFSPAGAAVSGIGVFLSEGAPQQSGLAPIDAACQFQLNAPFYDREWQTVAFSFTAESAWSHFAIGVFAPDSEVEFEVVEGGSPQLAYYFVDDFSLELAPEQLEEALDSKGPGGAVEPVGEGSLEAEPWYVPNAFSPNGDGENDLFLPVVNRGEVLVFEVYSRWGELLHESRSKQDLAWDGNDKKGKPVPQGMYIWKLRMRDESGKQPEQSGMLTLIR